MTTNPEFGMSLTYRDKTWGERPTRFNSDSDHCGQFYDQEMQYGSEHGISIELHERKREASPELPPFIVFFNTSGRAQLIEVDREQDLIDLLAHLAPITTATVLQSLLGEHGSDFMRAAAGDQQAKRRVAMVKQQQEREEQEERERVAKYRAEKARQKPPTPPTAD